MMYRIYLHDELTAVGPGHRSFVFLSEARKYVHIFYPHTLTNYKFTIGDWKYLTKAKSTKVYVPKKTVIEKVLRLAKKNGYKFPKGVKAKDIVEAALADDSLR